MHVTVLIETKQNIYQEPNGSNRFDQQFKYLQFYQVF